MSSGEDISKLLSRITIVPGLMKGMPTIRAMRFPAKDILELLSSGMTNEKILEDFPYLEKEDIQATLLYAAKVLSEIRTINDSL